MTSFGNVAGLRRSTALSAASDHTENNGGTAVIGKKPTKLPMMPPPTCVTSVRVGDDVQTAAD